MSTAGHPEPAYDRRMLIDGNWVGAANGQTLAVENPATKSEIATTPAGAAEDVDRAVRAADRAFASWSKVPPAERGRLLSRIAEKITARQEDFSRLIALDTGNAIRTQARPEAWATGEVFRYFGGLATELKGTTIPFAEHLLSYTRREPIGVVGAIVPWNAPLGLAALKIAPALCAGNTVVLKPAEDAPLAILLLAELCQELLPRGVLNVVTGRGPEAGAALSRHPLVRKISFTGSTEVGRQIMRAAADGIVPVSLELGGKSPAIVFPDADADWAVRGAAGAMRFTRQSQSCSAGSRLFVHADIFDSFLDKLAAVTESLVIGDPLDETTDIGTLINGRQFDKVCAFIEEGAKQPGARLVTGGLPPTEGPLAEGWFTKPTIFAGVANDWRMAREEIFGPVLAAIRWTDEADVVAMANATSYGLAGYVFSRDISRALRTAHAIEAGWILVNHGGPQMMGHVYGGYKQSGIGREFSLEGMLDSFTQRKNVTVDISV